MVTTPSASSPRPESPRRPGRRAVAIVVGIGVACVAFLLASVWYAVTCNESRLVEPMDFATYEFRPQDLPMICSVGLLSLYALSVAAWFVARVAGTMLRNRNRNRATTANRTRSIDPKLGLLGVLGLLGLLGVWTYFRDGSVTAFAFFSFFGFFGFFYEGRMSNTLMDERFRENMARAQGTVLRVVVAVTFVVLMLASQGDLFGSAQATLAVVVAVLALTWGAALFLYEYLLWHYDTDEPVLEGDGE